MTNETRERINAYKRALPGMRERVVAVALLLAMSVSMMSSASFAWLTLSRAPEISGMQTTVAANGNLEIALAQGSTSDPLVAPLESQIGDSSAAEGQSIVDANITWGNLVNVSDPTYGISEIALRPALLSDFNRTDYPLNGAIYGSDGRVVATNDRYEFASYEPVPGNDTKYYFAAGADAASGKSLVNYGVRAITSVGYVNYSGNERANKYLADTQTLYLTAQEYYGYVVSDEKNDVNTLDAAAGITCISALEGLVTVFAQDKINSMDSIAPEDSKGEKESCSPHLWYLYQMLLRMEKVLNDEGIALLELVNWQCYINSGDDKIEKKVASVDALLAMTETEWRNTLGLSENTIATLKSYKTDLNNLKFCIYGGTRSGKTYTGIESMAKKCENPKAPEVDYYWDDISVYVNILVDINTATLAGKRLSEISGMTDALAIIGGGDVIVYGGLLKNVEARLVNQDNRVKAKVEVTVRTGISIASEPTIPGVVYTDVGKKGTEPTYAAAVADAAGMVSTAKGEATAKDTYGLALDVWVRTNYPGAVLTLEGAAKYEDVRATISVEGTEYELSTISVTEGEATLEEEVYQKNGVWYYASTSAEVPSDVMGSQTPKAKYDQVIVGYEGENRVWEDWRNMLDSGLIQQDATTQGAGSCFVFYADTPTEQIKIMEMLEAFNVAFMDQNGAILGTAKLNLESAYANQGKVTVPLEMATGADYTDESGVNRKGITVLSQNTPLFITAVVYLNGSDLYNENVLSDSVLQGQLNIQFGTDSTLIAPKNEELQGQYRTITAEVTVDGQTISNGIIGDTDGDGLITGEEGLTYQAAGYKAKVTLTVEGDQPERISGFFVRVINSTQGTRGEQKDFTYNTETEKWEAEFTLTNPGKYAFNTLLVDGVQYTLHDGSEIKDMGQTYPPNRPYVYIKGLKIVSASVVGVAAGTHMTTDSSMAFPVEVVIESAVMPKQVSAQFFSADGSKQYTAILSHDGNNVWSGTANIGSSDTYTLRYIVVDGGPEDAPSVGSYTLYLGLTASITTTLPSSNWEFDFTGPSQITMQANIYDDAFNQITGVPSVILHYRNVASPAELEWKGKYYEGVLDIVQPGELTFQKIELGKEQPGDLGTIRTVSNAPRFLAISLETPEYVSGSAPTSQTVIANDKTATITVNMKEAVTAQNVWVELLKKDGNGIQTTIYVPANETSGDSRTFTLPKEDGDYTLERVFLQGVYDKNWVNDAGEVEGKWYANTGETPSSETESKFFILTASDKPKTEVIATAAITVKYGGAEKKTAFTEQYGSAEAAFMTSYNSEVLSVEVCDYKGRAFTGVQSVKWDITHLANTMQSYGGYTGTGVGTNTVTLTLQSGSSTVYEAPVQTFSVAGQYTSSIVVDFGGNGTRTITAVPTFEVRSKAPTLEIKTISPLGQHGTVTASKTNKTVTSSFNKETNQVRIYPEGSVSDDGCGSITGGTITKQPTVTLKLTGLGEADSAVLNFTSNEDEVRMYTGSGTGQTTAYTWTQETGGEVTRYIGYYAGGCSSAKSAGILTSSNELILKVGTKEYKVPVSVITIDNTSAT